jgi:hypothetical protein
VLAIFWLRAFVPLHADPLGDMSSFSVFRESDFPRLQKGEVMAAHAPATTFPRGLSAQFCYIVPVSLQKAMELHKNFNPSLHPELKVFLLVSSKRPLDDFSKLKSPPNEEPVRALARATAKHSTSLQMSSEEQKLLAKFAGHGDPEPFPPDVSAFWSDILRRRAADFMAGGLSRQPPYADSIRASDEAAALLKEQPRIQARFAPLTALLGRNGGNPSLYWEMFDVEGEAALSVGASYWRQNGAGWQSMDVDYYASGGYYVCLSFTELWPIKIGAQPATLVWRGDILSSLTVGTLYGVEKFIAGNFLIKDVRKNISALLKDAPR